VVFYYPNTKKTISMKKAFWVVLFAAVLFVTLIKIPPYESGKFAVAPATSGVESAQIYATTTLLFVGDVMLGRNVENLMIAHGASYPFNKIEELLKSVDSVVANLEGPVLTKHKKTPGGSFSFNFASTTGALLKAYNVDFVSLSNNHTLDYGTEGYRQTAGYLTTAGVLSFGHPTKITGPLYTVVGSTTLGFVGLNATYGGLSLDDATSTVKSAALIADFVIVGTHWGEEYKEKSNALQQKMARAFIDNGADLVVGHHPHVLQEIELYNSKPIFYSLGNFIFDQYFSTSTQETVAVKVAIGEGEVHYELLPVGSIKSQPYLMDEENGPVLLQKVLAKSRGVGETKWSVTRKEEADVLSPTLTP
jgi:gamma-polyglutamate biosynthesis protein CapA